MVVVCPILCASRPDDRPAEPGQGSDLPCEVDSRAAADHGASSRQALGEAEGWPSRPSKRVTLLSLI